MSGRGNYEIGVTSGWYSIGKAQELLGLAAKTAVVATYGANYIQVDFENTSEFFEPDVIERMRQVIDDLQVQWGAHGEISEFMGWEGAIEVIWKQSHRRLHQYLDGLYDFFVKGKNQVPGKDYKKYMPQYVNFHASNMPPIGLFVERYRYGGHAMLDFNGRENWQQLFDEPGNKELKEWFQKEILFNIFARSAGIVFYSDEDIVERGVIQDMVHEMQLNKTVPGSTNEEKEKYLQDFVEKMRLGFKNKDPEVTKKIHDFLYKRWLDTSALRNLRGSIDQEEWAYAVVAKYLEFKKDDPDEPLWKMYFQNRSMDDLEKEWSTDVKQIKLFDKARGVVNLMPEIVAMVATRYIIGHFHEQNLPEFLQDRKIEFKSKNLEWDKFYEKTPIEKLNKLKIFFTFETPDIIENQREGLQRIIHAKHIYQLVKAFNNDYILGWFDSEHYLHNGFDPVEEIRSCPDNMGEYFLGFHVGAPKPYSPGHDLIDVGSEAQRWIYIYSYELRKKGFGLKHPGIIVFERGAGRGGGQTPAQFIGQSVTSIRLIVEELLKDTPPEKLPLSFFGVSPEGFASPERQIAMMKEHYWDPLKGMLSVPEEEYTFFSKAALDKGKKPEEFKKEELR